jgi:hypothetical protein
MYQDPKHAKFNRIVTCSIADLLFFNVGYTFTVIQVDRAKQEVILNHFDAAEWNNPNRPLLVEELEDK